MTSYVLICPYSKGMELNQPPKLANEWKKYSYFHLFICIAWLRVLRKISSAFQKKRQSHAHHCSGCKIFISCPKLQLYHPQYCSLYVLTLEQSKRCSSFIPPPHNSVTEPMRNLLSFLSQSASHIYHWTTNYIDGYLPSPSLSPSGC